MMADLEVEMSRLSSGFGARFLILGQVQGEF